MAGITIGKLHVGDHGIRVGNTHLTPDPHKVVDKITHTAGELPHDLSRMPDQLEQNIKYLADEAVKAFIGLASSKAFQTYLHLLDAAVPDEVSLSVGPVSIHLGEVREKLGSIKKWANKHPKNKSQIKQMIKELAPTSVEIQLQVSAPVLDSLTLGGTLSYTAANFIDRIDALFEEIL